MEIKKLYDKGCTEEQIVTLTAATHRQVRQELKKYGYQSSRLCKGAQKELKHNRRGETYCDLASMYDTTVPQVLWALGKRAEAIEKLDEHLHHHEIAEVFGVTRARISQIVDSMPQEQNHELTDDDWINIRSMYNAGAKSVVELASLYGVATSTIYAGLKR